MGWKRNKLIIWRNIVKEWYYIWCRLIVLSFSVDLVKVLGFFLLSSSLSSHRRAHEIWYLNTYTTQYILYTYHIIIIYYIIYYETKKRMEMVKKATTSVKKKKKIWTLVNNHDNKQCMRDSKLMTCVLWA